MLCALLLPVMAFAQNITVKGQVTDANGEPIPGAYVSVQNSTAGTVTDLDGNYSISVAPNATLEFSFMGYVTSVAPVGGKSVVNATLIEDAEALEATVVIGYGTARRQDVTGSIASVGGESLRAVPANDVTHALEGRIAGVEMTQTSSRPGSILSGDNPKYASVLGYYNGSYLKIRTISLGYSLHRLAALKKAGISNFRVYATLQNPGLVLFSDFTKETGLDPESNANGGFTASGRPGPSRLSYVGYNTPNTRNILFGINLTF